MADRVHPADSSNSKEEEEETIPVAKPIAPATSKPIPPPGTYVVQIPKDQIYRYPPPENASRYRNRRSGRKGTGCFICCCFFLVIIIILVVLAAIAAGVLFLVYRPEAPKYSVEKIAIKGLNLTGLASSLTAPVFSPEFDVNVRAENPNDKISIYYKKDSSVSVSHNNKQFCTGVLPAFRQGTNNVTIFKTVLTGTGLVLNAADIQTLSDQQAKGRIPLGLKVRVPVQIKVGSVKTWTTVVKVKCDITVDKLTENAQIVSKKCDVDVKLWD